MEIQQIGYCETHADVCKNIEILDTYQVERKAIAGMKAILDTEIVQNIVTRFLQSKDRQGVRTPTQMLHE